MEPLSVIQPAFSGGPRPGSRTRCEGAGPVVILPRGSYRGRVLHRGRAAAVQNSSNPADFTHGSAATTAAI